MKKQNKKKPKRAAASKPSKIEDLKGPGHYVPQFWIRGFAGPGGRIFGRKRGETRAKQVRAGDIALQGVRIEQEPSAIPDRCRSMGPGFGSRYDD